MILLKEEFQEFTLKELMEIIITWLWIIWEPVWKTFSKNSTENFH